MKICFIADGNSIHARRWIEYFCNAKNEIHVLSTSYCTKPIKEAVVHNLPTAGKSDIPIDGIGVRSVSCSSNLPPVQRHSINIGKLIPRGIRESEIFNVAYSLYRVFKFKNKAKIIIKKLQPDLVHCLRLPIEGWIGGLVGYRPLVMTTFGNDMVYFAQKYFICRWLTKKAMSKTDLYFSDSLRDKYIAEIYGFSPSSLTFITPVTGGLKLEEFPIHQKNLSTVQATRQKLGIAQDANLLISVRGFKNFYIYTEALVKAIPQIVQEFPNTIFILKGNTQSREYLQLKELAKQFDVEKYVRFTDRLNVEELVDYFTASDIMVSVTLYDGCPVSMLEGMAYGLIPVMSVHSPIQEWIKNEWNGYLFNPRDSEDIARTITKALKSKDKFGVMRERNWDLINNRADCYKNMKVAEKMYRQVVNKDNI